MEAERAGLELGPPPTAPKDDTRVDFIRRLVLRTFPAVKSEKLNRKFASESVANILFEFLHLPDARLLLITDHGKETSGNVEVYAVPPPGLFRSQAGSTPDGRPQQPVCVLYMIKTMKAPVSTTKFHEEMMFGTLEQKALESLAQLLHDVYVPLIGNPRNQRMWPEMVAASIVSNVHGFYSSLQITLGQTKGATYLPLPWDQIVMESVAKSTALKAVKGGTDGPTGSNSQPGNNGSLHHSGSTILGKEQVHGLEGCLITWTKQIKNILKLDPETVLTKKQRQSHDSHDNHAGPMEELYFWRAKAKNLNSIFAQLQSDSIRKVLQYLDASKSTYNVPFAKLCKEVFLARAEANDNRHYLQPLAKWFEKLINAESFPETRDLFRPIMHSILLVWKCSRFYNTPARLVVLIRQICNEIIRKAMKHLNGKKLFELIDQDDLEQANSMLQVSLQVCAHFKSVYFDYKAKSVAEVPSNPWRIQNNALFIRLDAFLERCHDVLELTQTIFQFQKLGQMEIGGTKGKTLTTSVRQIHDDFQETLGQMKNVHYDLMDLDSKHFDDDFYTFRTRNKELERRLASVINQAFDDAKTIMGRFKCLDCFDELLDRPIIKNELERKHTSLIAAYASDLHVVQQIFVENREEPPIPHNLPPFAGAVTWCRGLAERIRFPMEKLSQMSPRVVLEREDSKEAMKMYTNVMAMLQEYEVHMVKQWGISIETSSKAKLKLPLIRRDQVALTAAAASESGSVTKAAQQQQQQQQQATPIPPNIPQVAAGQLFVNFDPALVQLLREVKYFLLLGLDIPEDALAIYKRAEVFRRQTGNLGLIIDMYNNIHSTLLPVERPLVKNYLDRMDQALNKGIKALNWKSHGIDVFLKESMTDVNEANTLLSQMKTHQARVSELLEAWIASPLLFDRKSKALSVAEFQELQQGLCQHKFHIIKEGGNEIHRLLKETLKCLRVSQGSPDWRAYVDYVSGMVEDGLTRVVLQSLRHLRNQLDPKRIESEDLPALLEIELDLYGKDIVYFPAIQSTTTKNGLYNIIMGCVEDILHCTTVFKRLDSSEGSYLKEMRENVQIQLLVADVTSFLEQNERVCISYRQALLKYEYLWTTDLPQMFAKFLESAWRTYPHAKRPMISTTTQPSDSTQQSSTGLISRIGTARGSSLLGREAKVVVMLQAPMPAQLLDLPIFEERIQFFLSLQNEISESKHAKDVGFVRINSLPIKQALSTWVTKWVYMFTQYLHDRVVNQLIWLDEFMHHVNAGLDQDVETDNLEVGKHALMTCMHHIRNVRNLMREDLLVNFEPLRSIVSLLKQNGISLEQSYVGKENVLSFLDQVPMRWENMVNKTFKKKEVIQPLQNLMVESIRVETVDFGRRVQALKDDFTISAPLHAPSGSQGIVDAYGRLDEYHNKLKSVEQEADRLLELEDMFELVSSKNDLLVTLRADFVLLKNVWDFVALLDDIYTHKWQTLTWNILDTDELIEELDAIDRCRNSVFPSVRTVKDWGVYQFLMQKLEQMSVILPLVKNLHSPVVRDRHWKNLMVLTRKHFDLSSSSSSDSSGKIDTSRHGNIGSSTFALRFEDVLRLDLFRYVNEVNDIVEMAAREFKIEQQLEAIEKVWSAFQLEFVSYRTTGFKPAPPNRQAKPKPKLERRTSASSSTKSVSDAGEAAPENDDEDLVIGDQKDGDVMILKMPNVIIESLEEHQLQLQTMAGAGKFVAYFKEKVFEWQLRLGNVDVILKLWISLQRQWCSLESIFLSPTGDIQRQLPSEFQRFQHVDQEIKELFADAVMFPSVLVACCQREGREQILRDLQGELEICQKALNQYLNGKKDIFPRFYFVSNASLLEILSNGNYPPKLQPHFGNCFDGIEAFEFETVHPGSGDSQSQDPQPGRHVTKLGVSLSSEKIAEKFLAMAMRSKEGEIVRFPDSHLIHGSVENWFNDLVVVMQDTLRQGIFDAIERSALWGVDCARHTWVFDYPAQAALLASQVVWTEEVEAALEEQENGNEEALKKYWDLSSVRLEELIRLVQGTLSTLDRQKIITLITVDVHARDVVQSLITKKVNSSLDFQWQSQLRYYLNPVVTSGGPPKKEVYIKICDFRSFYRYEYVGNCGRLVITPLTDRCYVTLTTALRLCLGGAPAGPAGTGKTETTKDLARGMGLQCYVFNCSDQMNYMTMADIFRGLAQTGAWGCFDEFNRISVEVLSVVATQVKTVLDGLVLILATGTRASTATAGGDGMVTASHEASSAPPIAMPPIGNCDFFGKTITLVPTAGFFITMNPGYAGRAELPENLKALFRSCAMIKPDLQPICENMLMAEGFLKARVLSIKFVTLYNLSSELLSKQKHYDWGLRAVKSVLLVAGSMRRALSDSSEEMVLMQVLRDFNTPRILPADYPVFLGLLNDLFPGQKLSHMKDETLRSKCIQVCASRKLQAEEGFMKKVMEYEAVLKVRHSVMLIGPAGCGKSTIWTTLAGCHNSVSTHDGEGPKPLTVFETVNPKAITADELYGYMTLENDWKDGVLSSIMRNMSKDVPPFNESQTYKWVVLDGDIDAVWIESMNTVMDDNKVLTLVSNERIPLTRSMRMVFEISSLINATPATVSRAGIIYVNESDIGWRPLAESWIQRRESAAENATLPGVFSKYIDSIFGAMWEAKIESVIPQTAVAIVDTLCRLLDSMLSLLSEQEKTSDVLENAFIYCGMWAFGGALESDKSNDQRKIFSNIYKGIAKYKLTPTSTTGGSNAPDAAAAAATANAPIFDLFYDITKNELVSWSEKVPTFVNAGDVAFHSLVVPTVESTRLRSTIDLLTRLHYPTLLVGCNGSGKSSLVHEFLKSLDDEISSSVINLHHFMGAREFQLRLEKFLEKRSGRVFGPLQNRQMVYFLDDLNMPKPEEFGTQTSLALLRQYMDYNSWYDRQDLGLKRIIQDVQFVAAMNHKTGSYTVNPRLQRHFSTLCVSIPPKSDLVTIFSTLITQHLQNFSDRIRKLASAVVTASVDLHEEVRASFVPTVAKFHYVFSIREMSSLFQGLFMSRPEGYLNFSMRFCRLWLHECYRVFSDRMCVSSDVQRFTEMAIEQAKKNFDEDQTELFATPLICVNFLSSGGGTQTSLPMAGAGADDTSGLQYAPVPDKAVLTRVLEGKLRAYNEVNPVMNIVLFDQALEHVTRIVRILSCPRGNALLIGVGGSGKQSLSRLSAFICGYNLFSLSMGATVGYNIADLKEDLKDICRKAGVRPAKPLVLMITDSQITDEKSLVPLNDLLTSGAVPDLFSQEEMDAMASSLRSEAKSRGIPDTKEHLQEFFHDRVRSNIHVVLAFSPVGANLRTRCRDFPSLTNCCVIDWFHPWPKEALIDVSMQFLKTVDLSTHAIQENVCHHMAEMHLSVTTASLQYEKSHGRFNYVTPTSFLELIRFYQSLLASKRSSQSTKINRLEVGLATLKKTAHDVAGLQEELKRTMKKVDDRKKATDILLEQMGKQRGDAEVKQRRADQEKSKASKAAETASQIESQALVELAIAKPALDAAQQAVNCLNKASLTELKSMGKPPAGVEKVTAAVLMMIKNETKNFSWDNAKKMMAKVDTFKQSLEQYDKENIPPEVVARVEPLIQEDPNFNYEKMKSKSVAAANLCVWVINIIAFHHVYVRVKPLMDGLEEARRTKAEADSELESVQKMVAEVEAQLSTLQASFREATNEKAKVEAEAHACQERLSLAERLVNGLASENERWSREIDVLRAGETALIGDSLLAAGFVSYIGAFNASFRVQLWKHTWLSDILTREIPITLSSESSRRSESSSAAISDDNGITGDGGQTGGAHALNSNMVDGSDQAGVTIDPMEMLSDSSSVAQWMNEGLPADRISIENGCIITSCERWPLLVDPQLQGILWLRARDFRREEKRPQLLNQGTIRGIQAAAEVEVLPPLVILQQSQKNWTKTLKTAISGGQNVILENVGETIDASLEPILMRRVYKKGRSWFMLFAAEEVEFDPRFRLFLHTKLPNPHYRPEILAYCTLIDFSVTERGLEDQLLANVVNLEQPELETQKRQLQQEFNGYQIQLLQLENQLLERLSSAPEDILSDVALIEGLEKTKRTANEVSVALLKGKEAEKDINLAREVYRPVANEASMLYFLMGQLSKVSHMYRYSLDSFMTFFYSALAKVVRDPVAAATNADSSSSSFMSSAAFAAAYERVPLLREALRWAMFVMVSRGLLEEHKLLFLTQLVLSLLRRGAIGASSGYTDEFARFLLQGPKAIGPDNSVSWLSDSQWQALQALITLEPFERFVADLEESEQRFREWYNSPNPEHEKLPLDWRDLDKSAPFLKLLVVRCMRPDRLTQAIASFIAVTLPSGGQYINCDGQLNSFSILKSAFKDSTAVTPMYFILSPGTDVVADVDKFAVQDEQRIKGVDYHNIALGQGQEEIAMKTLQVSAENGYWVILNNVHLMPNWLLQLDKWLEQIARTAKSASYASLAGMKALDAEPSGDGERERSRSVVISSNCLHPAFRLFITSDPSPNIPIGVLERSIKLTNEPPTGLRANVKRAFCCFSKTEVDELEPRTRCILFALCYFHSLVLERKKFGTQGFNMSYPFASSDLIASSAVLRNYMDNAPARVPWQDLRYLFGEIMYGGHIVNELDRVVAATYLQYFLRDDLLEELSMVPFADDGNGGPAGGNGGSSDVAGESGEGNSGVSNQLQRRDFFAPKLSSGYDRILEHVNSTLLNETPTAFGLHPNAEVAFRTEHGNRLFQTLLLFKQKEDNDSNSTENELDDDGGGAIETKENVDSVQMVAEGVLQDILETYREFRFDIQELFFKHSSADRGSGSSKGGRSASVAATLALAAAEEMDPFQNVLLQECERMNQLLDEMTSSLLELEMAFRGEVTLTEAMEDLQECLYYERIPPSWEAVAYPSRRALAPWLANLQQRIAQLQEWSGQAPDLPLVLWLPGFFNPQSFLTAILQIAARKNNLELEKLAVATDITKRSMETVDAPSRDGQYVYGLYLEGARWDIGNSILDTSLPKEMYVTMPVVNCRAVLANRRDAMSTSAGSNVFECPVYRTQQRGSTFIFSAQLRTKAPPSKWVLAGVALLMEVV